MEESAKKRILLGIIVVCFVTAGAITLLTRPRKGGIPESFATVMTWVKCRNPACEAEYQITKKQYFEYVEKHDDPSMGEAPPLICKKCGEHSVHRAVKCENCGLVFEMGTIRGDYQDRCPKCRHSKLETNRQKATAPD